MRHLRKNYKPRATATRASTISIGVSEVVAPAPPTPTPSPAPPRQELVFGFRPDPTKEAELFAKAGKSCKYCSSKVDAKDMVLCQCGDFMCSNCFINGFCGDASVNSQEKGHIIPPNPSGATVADFVTTAVYSGSIDMDGETRNLDIIVESLRPLDQVLAKKQRN